MQMIWIRMPAQRQKCKKPWIKSHSHVITMISQSAKKTEVVHQPAPGKPYNEPTITVTVNEQKLKIVDKFTYLRSTLSRAVHIDDEVTARIAKASVAVGRLRANVWERNGIKLDTKLWRNTRGEALSRWPEEMLQRHPQGLSEGFRHTYWVFGTD